MTTFVRDEILTMWQARYQDGRLPHALLFLGERGWGRDTTALALGEVVYGKTLSWVPLSSDRDTGILTDRKQAYLLDGTQGEITISQVRTLQEELSYAREQACVNVLLGIDDMQVAAANALLKTIEEPPPNVFFIMTARDQERVLPTIRSRVVISRFHALDEKEWDELWRELDVEQKILLWTVTAGDADMAQTLLESGWDTIANDVWAWWHVFSRSTTPYRDLRAIWDRQQEPRAFLRWLVLVAHDVRLLRSGIPIGQLFARFYEQEMRSLATQWNDTQMTAVIALCEEALQALDLRITQQLVGDIMALGCEEINQGGTYANRSRGAF